MKYFSQNPDFLNAECEHCKRTLKIKRALAIPTSTGFELNPPGGIRCLCGAVHHSVAGTVEISSSTGSESVSSKNNSFRYKVYYVYPTPAIILGLLFIILVLGLLYKQYTDPEFFSKPTVQDKANLKPDKIEVMTFARILVEKQLKAPSTAKHPLGVSNYQITDLGDNRYRVSS